MITNHPYPYQHPTPAEIQALIRRAHAERAQVVREFFTGLFRRKPAVRKAENEPSLAHVACH